MLRWPWVLLLVAAGGVLIGVGIQYELGIRAATGERGFARWVAYSFYGKSIAANRWLSRLYVLAGTAVVLGAFVLRRRRTIVKRSR
jgi:hypothetical protein